VILRRDLLVDRDIQAALRRGELVVPELDPELVRPAALSLRLGNEAYGVTSRQPVKVTDPATYPELVPRPVEQSGVIILHPGEVLLVRTQERVGLSDRLAGLLDGTSDWARLGVSVVLAHQVGPGYGIPDGAPLTLEIVSRLNHDVQLRPGTRIANLLLRRGRRAPAIRSDARAPLVTRMVGGVAVGRSGKRAPDPDRPFTARGST
jgi:dCTP deaminase